MKNEYEISLSTVLSVLKNYKYNNESMSFKNYLLNIIGIECNSGIYAFQNICDKKLYIGSSKELSKRIRSHINMLKNNNHHSPHFQYAWNNGSSFNLLILEIVQNEELLIEREQYWMDYYQSYNDDYGYNISPTAGNTLGVTMTQEAKNKMSQKRKGKNFSSEHRRKIGIANKGKVRSLEVVKQMSERQKGFVMPEETKEKLRQSCKGINTGERSMEVRKKMSEACKGRISSNRKLTDQDVREIKKLLSERVPQREIAQKLNVSKGTIASIYKNKTYKNVI